jgi:hypothetical protein
LECLYYQSHDARADVLQRLIKVFNRPPVFISGPITGASYFTEPWLMEQFNVADYKLIDCAVVSLRAGAADLSKMRGAGHRARSLRMESANQVIYYFRPRRRWRLLNRWTTVGASIAF